MKRFPFSQIICLYSAFLCRQGAPWQVFFHSQSMLQCQAICQAYYLFFVLSLSLFFFLFLCPSLPLSPVFLFPYKLFSLAILHFSAADVALVGDREV